MVGSVSDHRGGGRVYTTLYTHLHDVPVRHAVLPGVRAVGAALGVTTVICRSEEGVWY